MTQTEARSQNLTFSRRRFWGLAGLAIVRPTASQQFVKIPPHLPAPEFAIGDTVASDWDDEFGVRQTEIGRVAGICWHPRHQQWEYLVDWLKGCGPSEAYPCFDGHLVEHAPEAPLRRVYAPH